MRQLTARQKKVIDRFMIENPDARTVDDIGVDILLELERINDTEILYNEISRYMSDKVFSNL
ncbi:MAG: hypothetical protein WC764_04325 [Candidatus Paceibacterota bacterium]